MSSILFIHENFPAQFGRLAEWLRSESWDVKFATARAGTSSGGLDVVEFKPHRAVAQNIHHYLKGYERAIINGQAFARVAIKMRKTGYRPDIVVAHSGWGVGSFVKDVWPETKFVPYFEWYYSWPPVDRTRHDKTSDDLEGRAKARVRNSPMWLDLSSADAAICPTQFQAAQFPPSFRSLMTILPDGIDTELHRPGPRSYDFLSRLGIPRKARVLTYLARGMEPMRGFPEMMEAVEKLQSRFDDLHTIVVGADRVAYGGKSTEVSWKQRMLAQLRIDQRRIHFTGVVSRADMIKIFQSSDAHLFLTAPFVLSWSALEAMSSGCLLVASNTPPVREFMQDGETAIFVEMNDIQSIVNGVEKALLAGDQLQHLRRNARSFVVNHLDAEAVAYKQKQRFFDSLLDY